MGIVSPAGTSPRNCYFVAAAVAVAANDVDSLDVDSLDADSLYAIAAYSRCRWKDLPLHRLNPLHSVLTFDSMVRSHFVAVLFDRLAVYYSEKSRKKNYLWDRTSNELNIIRYCSLLLFLSCSFLLFYTYHLTILMVLI